MAYRDDPEVFADAYQLYQAGKYQEAYDLLTAAAPGYPEHDQRIYQWRFDIAALMGKLELSEQVLEEALDHGCFYNEFALRRDEDLMAMQGRTVFEALAARSARMLAEAQTEARPLLRLFHPVEKKGSRIPLFMGLHGNNSNIEKVQGFYDGLTTAGWLVALPQSSQVGGKGIYVWNDMEIAAKELRVHYQEIKGNSEILEEKNILSGFSKGGQAAIQGALESWLPVAGFITVAPYVGNPLYWQPLLERYKGLKMRGYFLLGENDEMCTPGALKLAGMMNEVGLICDTRIFPGLGHGFPDDFNRVLPEAIEFILEKM